MASDIVENIVSSVDITAVGSPNRIKKGANFASGSSAFNYYNVLTEGEIFDSINRGNPVVVLRVKNNNKNDGHSTVIYGYRYNGIGFDYLIRDPWPATPPNPWPDSPITTTGQNRVWSYSYIVSGNDTGRWESSVKVG